MRITDGGGAPAVPPEPQPAPSSSSAPKTEPSSGGQSSASSIVHYLSAPESRVNLRGLAVSSQSSASVSRTSSDFELGRITTYNLVTRDAEFTATQSSSLKVTTVSPSSSSEKTQAEDENSDDESNVLLAKANLHLIGVQGYANASVASVTFSNRQASFTLSALGAEASGQASLGITHDGIAAQASGNADAYLVDAKAGVHVGPAEASGEALVGAGANGDAQVAFNPLKGDVGANAGVGAFAGAQANETGTLSADGTSASETANVGAGVGFDAKFDAGIDKGKIDVSFDVGAYLGVGAGADVSFSVNVPKLADSAWHDITSFL